MGGGSSKSSSTTDQAQTTLSADGVITGQVFNVSGKENTNFTYTDEFPKDVADILNKLVDFSSGVVTGAQKAYEDSLAASNAAFEQAKQPDAALVKNQSNSTYILMGGALLVLAIVLIKRK